MDIRPIFSSLGRHKTAATLIVLEIALSCAILCNAVFMIGGRLERMQRISGLEEQQIVRVELADFSKNENAAALVREDLAALRALPGVKAATSTSQITFGGSLSMINVKLTQEQTNPTLDAANYMGDEQLLDTLGLNLIAGRPFTPDEFVEWKLLDAPNSKVPISSAIITRSMASKLFPGQNPLGKSFYAWGDAPHTVVGVVDHLVRPRDSGGATAYEYSMIFPVRGITFGNYLLRVDDPLRRAEVLKAAAETLKRNGPNRIILNQDTLEQMRSDYYRQDRSMAWLLIAVIVALLVVTALGIVGLTSFWVQQRTRQIGIRRALGATRGQILRYFLTENFLLATIGIVLGMALAYGINGLLMERYELPRLPIAYLPIGAIALWVLGQLAVLGPALRAAAVPPAVATRSV